MFAKITHLDDVLPHISLEGGIRLLDQGGYQVLDYNFVEKDTFDSPFALECRGLKFASDGRLIARPFHKFFNLGEKEQPENIDLSEPHVVQEKRDGSMVHPCLLDGALVFMTRKGKTDHADLALSHASPAVLDLCAHLLEGGITPMFEFTSPQNRVVVAYERPEIVLLAARDMTSGAYLPFTELQALATRFAIPLVQSHGAISDLPRFVETARGLEGEEGYVIAFDSGHRIKLKADAYVLRHRALDGMRFEKVVLAWIAEGAVDDVLPILRPDAAEALTEYASTVEQSLSAHETRLQTFWATHRGLDRKSYALAAQSEIDPRLQRVAFALLDGRGAREELLKILRWAAHSENRVGTIRDLMGTTWNPPDLRAVEP